MNKNKFKFWNPQTQSFVQNYKYNGYVDHLFDPDPILKPKQFIGILDNNMKEIYEGDVVKLKNTTTKEGVMGVVRYSNDYCAYVIDHDDGFSHIWSINIESLKVVGNIMKDYIWNEEGKLIKNENANP